MATPDVMSLMDHFRAAELMGDLGPWKAFLGADSGEPQDRERLLYEGNGTAVGVWECTPGGWTTVDRASTETMMVLMGRVRITPRDGEPVELVAGDVFVLPKGWYGRWDVLETVRKLAIRCG